MTNDDQDDTDLLEAIEDALNFQERVVHLLMGETHPSLFGETTERKVEGVLREIRRQLISGNLSRLAIEYLDLGLSLHLDARLSLNESFYPIKKKSKGGQPIKLEVKRATVIAYLTVINRDSREWNVETKSYDYRGLTNETKGEARQAALKAYRAAGGGKSNKEETYRDDEAAIEKTINKILKEATETKFLR